MTDLKRVELIAKTEAAYDIMARVYSELVFLLEQTDNVYQMSREVCRELLALRELLNGGKIWQIKTR